MRPMPVCASAAAWVRASSFLTPRLTLVSTVSVTPRTTRKIVIETSSSMRVKPSCARGDTSARIGGRPTHRKYAVDAPGQSLVPGRRPRRVRRAQALLERRHLVALVVGQREVVDREVLGAPLVRARLGQHAD